MRIKATETRELDIYIKNLMVRETREREKKKRSETLTM